MSMTRNEGGGFVFRNVGDNNPRITFESNSIERCGVGTLNITSPTMIDMFVQVWCGVKLAFHDADTDTGILVDILARIVARKFGLPPE